MSRGNNLRISGKIEHEPSKLLVPRAQRARRQLIWPVVSVHARAVIAPTETQPVGALGTSRIIWADLRDRSALMDEIKKPLTGT